MGVRERNMGVHEFKRSCLHELNQRFHELPTPSSFGMGAACISSPLQLTVWLAQRTFVFHLRRRETDGREKRKLFATTRKHGRRFTQQEQRVAPKAAVAATERSAAGTTDRSAATSAATLSLFR